MAAGSIFAVKVKIGEAEPGSPLLYPKHDYNVSSKAINERFPGSEELYIVARTTDRGGLKRPEVLHAMDGLPEPHALRPRPGRRQIAADADRQRQWPDP
jgi:predicted RND superfamily exporter protein